MCCCISEQNNSFTIKHNYKIITISKLTNNKIITKCDNAKFVLPQLSRKDQFQKEFQINKSYKILTSIFVVNDPKQLLQQHPLITSTASASFALHYNTKIDFFYWCRVSRLSRLHTTVFSWTLRRLNNLKIFFLCPQN